MLPTPIVVDTDPGIDDVVALALALRSPELRIVALVTSYGNATLDAATRNVRDLLDRAGRPDVPLLPGAGRPLDRALVTARATHGPSGVGYAAVSDETPTRPDHRALLRALDLAAEPVVLVTLGPLTNLAAALAVDPDLVRRRVRGHLGMFGSVYQRGSTRRWADFNAWCDPEAAARVLRAGLDTVMVGLDVTRRMTIGAVEVQCARTSADPLTRWLGDALQFYVESHRAQGRCDGCVVNDVLPIGEILTPGLLDLAERRLTVDLGENESRGRTVESDDGSPVRVALGVDVLRMRELLTRVLDLRLPRG
jgi:pyrimidine-specific ribonucleoside hydrolase